MSNNNIIPRSDNKLCIALSIQGGLGDCVVSEAFYEKIIKVCPDCDIYIIAAKGFGECVFGGKKNIKGIFDINNPTDTCEVDVFIKLRLFASVLKINKEKVNKFCPCLLKYLINENKENTELEASNNKYKDLVIIKRARSLSLNRFGLLGNGIFDLSENMVKIDVDEKLKELIERAFDYKYITINQGANHEIIKSEMTQTKVASLKVFNELIKYHKENHKDIRIIQIGDKYASQMDGVDEFIFDKPLEYVKAVLAKSLLHVDCEGGLVHLATGIGTKCAVMFGPTPVFFYGYKDNLNYTNGYCEWCMGIVEDWFTHCYNGSIKCMDIDAADMYTKIEDVMGIALT